MAIILINHKMKKGEKTTTCLEDKQLKPQKKYNSYVGDNNVMNNLFVMAVPDAGCIVAQLYKPMMSS